MPQSSHPDHLGLLKANHSTLRLKVLGVAVTTTGTLKVNADLIIF